MTHRLFAYGSLVGSMPDESRAVLHGFERLDGPFPTITPSEGSTVEGVVSPVDDWGTMDRYEGHRPGVPERSLYWRMQIGDTGVLVYVGNPEVASRTWGGSWDTEHSHEQVAAAAAEADLEVID